MGFPCGYAGPTQGDSSDSTAVVHLHDFIQPDHKLLALRGFPLSQWILVITYLISYLGHIYTYMHKIGV